MMTDDRDVLIVYNAMKTAKRLLSGQPITPPTPSHSAPSPPLPPTTFPTTSPTISPAAVTATTPTPASRGCQIFRHVTSG